MTGPAIEAEMAYRVEQIRRHHREARALAEWLGRVFHATKSRLPGGNRQTAEARGATAGEVQRDPNVGGAT